MPVEVDIRRASVLGSAIRGLIQFVRRGIVVTITLVLAGMFVLGYVTAYLPPAWFWWTSPFAVILPYVSALLAPLAMGRVLSTFRRRAWGDSLGALVLCVLIGVRFGPDLWTEPRALKPNDLRLMTLNAPTHGPSPAALANAFTEKVGGEMPDILSLQETQAYVAEEGGPLHPGYSAPHLYRLLQIHGFMLPQVVPLRLRLKQPVVARLPMDTLTLLGSDDPLSRQDQAPASRVVFRWRNEPVVLFNIHLNTVSKRKPWREAEFQWLAPRTWGPYLTAYRQATLERAEEARAIRNAIEQETRPVIVTGDFNSTIHHWEYRHIAEGMQDVLRTAGEGWQATYPARFPLVGIDHILASPEWTVVSGQAKRSYPYTDHRAVHARLRLGP